MDFSKQYIRMCDYRKIQNSLPKEDDYYICFIQPHWLSPNLDEKYYVRMQPRNKIIRCPGKYRQIKLPMQSQIQEKFFKEAPWDSWALISSFRRWLDNQHGFYFGFKKAPLPNPSIEQLWLAYHVYEKHSETWNGEKWIKR